ncbi:MAG: putative metal-dependent hydrolase [Gemmatimonadota bacterium]|nr:putative metal-dependent hydrolase [Gemmatimonadota bacterium]
MSTTAPDLRFPIGKFAVPAAYTPELRAGFIDDIARTPAKLRAAVAGLSDAQLETPYRPDGWTVRQVVHHVPDSHLNAFVRFKLGLTEDEPTIKPYAEDRWAELVDGRTGPIEPSLTLLEALHVRWSTLLRAMTPQDFARQINHPESGKAPLDRFLALYSWHGKHHVAHITALRERQGW